MWGLSLSLHRDLQLVNTKIRLIMFFEAKYGEALYGQLKQDQKMTVVQIKNLWQNSDVN